MEPNEFGRNSTGVNGVFATGPNVNQKLYMALNKVTIKNERETEHLLKIFPVEIWKMIFEQLQDSTDLYHTWQSCDFFRDLLNHQRQFFLFPNVWEVLGLKYEQSNDLSYSEYDLPKSGTIRGRDRAGNPWCTTCGRRRQAKWFSGILSLRLVCKSWSESITKFYQNLPPIFKRETHPKSPIYSGIHWSQTFLHEYSEHIPSQFLEHFQETHGGDGVNRSPFVGRKLTVMYGYTVGINERTQLRFPRFISAVYALTQKYGSHVRALNLCERGRISNSISHYTIIRDILQRTPNLVALHISEEFPKRIPDQIRRVIATAIFARSIPIISRLEFLSVKNINNTLFGEIIRMNSKITKLEISGVTNVCKLFITKVALPSLRELSIKVDEAGIHSDLFENFQARWPLTKLCLDFDHSNTTDWMRLFGFVEMWKDTLTDLILTFPKSDQNPIIGWADFQLNLDKIKNLKIVLSDLYPLDFILSMRNTLEYLEVRVPKLVDDTERKSVALAVEMDSKIKLLRCSKQSLDSNVWEICPALRRIDFWISNSIFDQDNFKIWSNRRWDWEMGRTEERWPNSTVI